MKVMDWRAPKRNDHALLLQR